PAILLADIATDSFQFKSDSRDGVTTSPEMLPREVALSALQAGDGNRALALEKTDDRGDSELWWNLDHHMDVVGHQMSFDDPTLFLPRQLVKDVFELAANLPIE